MYTLLISPIAQDDLKKIYQFGALNWGAARASDYIEQLKMRLWSLTKHPQIGIKRDELLSTLCSLAVERHVIFYRVKKQQIEIVRILHCRQDPQRHIE